jgi:hypothetical protein
MHDGARALWREDRLVRFPSPRIPFAIRKLPVVFPVFSWWYPRPAAGHSSRAARSLSETNGLASMPVPNEAAAFVELIFCAQTRDILPSYFNQMVN